jgi:hypothetical protein
VRDLRDILAECMRRERLGLMRPLWADWCAADNLGGPEQVRIRADHLIRLLAVHGVSLVRSSEPATIAQTSPTVWRWGLAGTDAERLIRASADDPNEWQIVRAEGDQETIQMRFRLAEAYVLSRGPEGTGRADEARRRARNPSLQCGRLLMGPLAAIGRDWAELIDDLADQQVSLLRRAAQSLDHDTHAMRAIEGRRHDETVLPEVPGAVHD